MTILSKRIVKLVVISDFICPWCYIGYRELQNALAQCSNLPLEFQVEYRPFIVSPGLSETPMDKEEYLTKKFGKMKFEAVNSLVTQKAEEAGVNISFQGKISQSTRAHRLMMKALHIGGPKTQADLLRNIFKAYQQDEQDLCDLDMLSDLAEASGLMSKAEALDFLKSDELLAEVEAQIAEARQKGVTGVPFTIIDGKWAVGGGQQASVYVKIFQRLATAESLADQSGAPSPSSAVATAA
ncbi:thioredoxin-like protein [Stereum hirsutum FP-91666 SS1]|uniref:thioredoxin-like protein n=1 Tax=Stereum hirsutum (strain FP-91666) TaxID=721885 RepID=UPI00044104D8|nr:thioredoxin-like protein [Stereum hirsutum FP-91666 SS1]EIM90808.1 thioredoxin-like protein [Stereum hirsutum FP-91666 SS1]